jgi:pimeloyl-ACP methyl ester carboxylesterase
MHVETPRSAAIGLAVLSATLAWNATAAQATDKKPGKEPIVIEAQGSFFLGGQNITSTVPAGDYTLNQMYVQYKIPKHKRPGAYPVIMVHGSTHSGKSYDTTPDGREGWQTYFLRRGYPVYVVDAAGRGRSGFNSNIINQARTQANPALLPNIRRFANNSAWTSFRIGTSPYVPFPNTKFPIEAKDQYFAQLVPDAEFTLEQGSTGIQTINALGLLIDKIGPSVVMVHSLSGNWGVRTVVSRPAGVKAFIDVEPAGGCAVTDQEITSVFKKVPTIVVLGDGNDAFTTGIQNTCRPFMDKIDAAGGSGTFLHLPEAGFGPGNTHMLMMDKNSDKIADYLIRWLDKETTKPGHYSGGDDHHPHDHDGHGGGHDWDKDRADNDHRDDRRG